MYLVRSLHQKIQIVNSLMTTCAFLLFRVKTGEKKLFMLINCFIYKNVMIKEGEN